MVGKEVRGMKECCLLARESDFFTTVGSGMKERVERLGVLLEREEGSSTSLSTPPTLSSHW